MTKIWLRNGLLSDELKARFKEVGIQDTSDPLVIAKFFNPCGAATWYTTAYNDEDNMCYGYVAGLVSGFDEWGYFTIDELEDLCCPPLNLPIERDLYFEETRFSELRIL